MTFETVLFEKRGKVGLDHAQPACRAERADAQLVSELNQVLDACEADTEIGAMVLTGSERRSRPAPTSRK